MRLARLELIAYRNALGELAEQERARATAVRALQG